MSDNGRAMKYDVEIGLRKSGVQGGVVQEKIRDEMGDENEEEKQMIKTNVKSVLMRLHGFDLKMYEYKTRPGGVRDFV